jgi:hypothetical protein
MATKRVYTKRLSPIQESTRKRSSPRRGSVKRKREHSSELKREASNERKRLSSEEAWQRVLNGFSKRDKENRNTNLKLLKKELNKNKNKNETMNLLSNKRANMKRKFTFRGLGKPLGIKI